MAQNKHLDRVIKLEDESSIDSEGMENDIKIRSKAKEAIANGTIKRSPGRNGLTESGNVVLGESEDKELDLHAFTFFEVKVCDFCGFLFLY